MKYVFMISSLIAFLFLGWLLKKLAGGDISKIFLWNKYVYILLVPISLFMWVYKAIKFNTWFDPKNNFEIVIFGENILYIFLLILLWFIYCKSYRNQTTTLKYGIVCHKAEPSTYAESRLMMFLIGTLIINPVLNIFFVVTFIKDMW